MALHKPMLRAARKGSQTPEDSLAECVRTCLTLRKTKRIISSPVANHGAGQGSARGMQSFDDSIHSCLHAYSLILTAAFQSMLTTTWRCFTASAARRSAWHRSLPRG